MSMHAFAAYPEPRSALHLQRLLVVEDDLDMRPFFDRIVGSVATNVLLDWADSVRDAIQRLNRERYDLVVSDFLLDGSGSGLTLKNWCDYNYPRTRFTMMSAFPIADALAADDPPDAFLRKPFTLAQLRRFLNVQLAVASTDS